MTAVLVKDEGILTGHLSYRTIATKGYAVRIFSQGERVSSSEGS
jgi:hypothetical protein